MDNNFSMLTSSDLLSKPVEDLKHLVKTKRSMSDSERDAARREEERKENEKMTREANDGPGVSSMEIDDDKKHKKHKKDDVQNIPKDEITVLEGHTAEVFICAWSPTAERLASGGGDATARVWTVPAGPSGRVSGNAVSAPLVLKHEAKKGSNQGDKGDSDDAKGTSNGTKEKAEDKTKRNSPERKKDGIDDWANKSKDVTTLDWNFDGSLLATGSYDGIARVWNGEGELLFSLDAHEGPIFSLKWNKKGTALLSGSVDKTAIAWSAQTGEVLERFAFHTGPTLDVDWRDDESFATSSMDHSIFVCKLGSPSPIKQFKGHTDEVNAIKWDPTGTLLASCSDDYTCKVWTVDNDSCLFDFRDHQKEIYTIKWSPTGPGTRNPDLPLLLASASYDATVKLWDVQSGTCVHTLAKHTDPVYSVAFSPDGKHLASGSFDKRLHVWRVKDGKRVKTHKGEGGIFEVCWNAGGDKIAACYSNNTVNVISFKPEDA